MRLYVLSMLLVPVSLSAQEASSGFDLRATVSVGGFYSHQLSEAPRSDGPDAAGFRAILYPTWKLNDHWTVSAAVQTRSSPYAYEDFSMPGYALHADVLHASLNYSRFWRKGSLAVRAGQLSTVFGGFLLHYDDGDNSLVDTPLAYGYYYKGVSYLSVAGIEADTTFGKWDARGQFANSSPTNPRSLLDHDQYGNWAGGLGYTLRQGLRVGASTYYGPYLDRHYAFYFPGEAKPRDLPATAVGIDAQWAAGHWNVQGEWQKFHMSYRLIPPFDEQTGYVEAKRVLSPRWYLAARAGYLRPSAGANRDAYEIAAGYRPNRYQLLKVGYEVLRGPDIRGTLANTLAIQLVTCFDVWSLAK